MDVQGYMLKKLYYKRLEKKAKKIISLNDIELPF